MSGPYQSNELKGIYPMRTSNDYVLSLTLIGCLAAHVSNADDRESTSAPAPAQESTTEFPKMTVSESESAYTQQNSSTATKTDTPLLETPVSIQVITQQLLEDQNALTLDQALVNVPGVRSSYNGYSLNIYLRGFPTSTIFRDGFRIDDLSTLGGDISLSNVESIEVLKGPASILYGRVEPGGIVNIITKQPKDTESVSAQQEIGSWGERRTVLDAAGPMTEDHAWQYSLNLSHYQSNSFVDNVWERRDFIAPSLRWAPDDKTQVTLEASYLRNPSVFYQQVEVPYATATNQFLFGPISSNPSPAEFDRDTTFLGLRWSHRFSDGWEVRQFFSHNRIDISTPVYWDNGYGAFGQNANGVWVEQLNSEQGEGWNRSDGTVLDIEGHFSTGAIKHVLLTGGDYYDVRGAYNATYSNPNGPFLTVPLFSSTVYPTSQIPLDRNAFAFSDNATKSYGIYVQDQVTFPQSIEFVAGLRYQHALSYGIATQGTDLYGTGIPAPSRPPADHAVTPRLALLWRPWDQVSFYGSYTENFGASNATVTDWRGRPLPPEGARQWELGAKAEPADGRVAASFAVYKLTKINEQAEDPAHPSPLGGFYLEAIGQTESKGYELSVQGRVLDGWDVLVAYSYDDVVIAAGTTSYPTGTRLPQVPEQMLRLWTTYRFSRSLQGLKVGAGMNLQSSAPGLFANQSTFANETNVITNPPFHTFDAMVSWEHQFSKTRLTAQLNVRNALNHFYYTDAFVYVVPSGYLTIGPPRSVVGSIKLDF